MLSLPVDCSLFSHPLISMTIQLLLISRVISAVSAIRVLLVLVLLGLLVLNICQCVSQITNNTSAQGLSKLYLSPFHAPTWNPFRYEIHHSLSRAPAHREMIDFAWKVKTLCTIALRFYRKTLNSQYSCRKNRRYVASLTPFQNYRATMSSEYLTGIAFFDEVTPDWHVKGICSWNIVDWVCIILGTMTQLMDSCTPQRQCTWLAQSQNFVIILIPVPRTCSRHAFRWWAASRLEAMIRRGLRLPWFRCEQKNKQTHECGMILQQQKSKFSIVETFWSIDLQQPEKHFEIPLSCDCPFPFGLTIFFKRYTAYEFSNTLIVASVLFGAVIDLSQCLAIMSHLGSIPYKVLPRAATMRNTNGSLNSLNRQLAMKPKLTEIDALCALLHANMQNSVFCIFYLRWLWDRDPLQSSLCQD